VANERTAIRTHGAASLAGATRHHGCVGMPSLSRVLGPGQSSRPRVPLAPADHYRHPTRRWAAFAESYSSELAKITHGERTTTDGWGARELMDCGTLIAFSSYTASSGHRDMDVFRLESQPKIFSIFSPQKISCRCLAAIRRTHFSTEMKPPRGKWWRGAIHGFASATQQRPCTTVGCSRLYPSWTSSSNKSNKCGWPPGLDSLFLFSPQRL
jgi:hypothetical protein